MTAQTPPLTPTHHPDPEALPTAEQVELILTWRREALGEFDRLTSERLEHVEVRP